MPTKASSLGEFADAKEVEAHIVPSVNPHSI